MSNVISLRVPKYRRHKAKGLAMVTIAGRDFYLGKYNSAASREEYRRLIAEYLQTGMAPSEDSHGTITVVEVLAAYQRFASDYYRKAGKRTREYEKVLEVAKVIRSLYGRTLATEFGPLALKTVRQAMIDADHSRKYVNKSIERARRVFKWAAAEELIPSDVPQALSMVAGLKKGRTTARETAPIPPVADDVVTATLDHLPAVVADMVRLQRLTGMRPAEVCILRPCDLDRSGDVWLYRPGSHKMEHHDRERVVLIGPRSQEVLLRYLARDSEAYCFQPRDSEAKRLAERQADRQTPLSCGNRPGTNRKRKPKRQAGECYSTCTYRRSIYRACDKAFPHSKLGSILRASFSDAEKKQLRTWQRKQQWAPNQLRHSAATEVRREFGLEAAQVILGHSAADVTQVYAERDLAKGIEVARRIG